MPTISTVVLLLGGYPLGKAWHSNRPTPLVHSLTWAFFAWAAWVAVFLMPLYRPDGETAPLRYFALILTGCALVAVLGARRPGAAAWNGVVAALLAVALLPLAESYLFGGRLRLEWFRVVLVGGAVAVGVLNYLPTRLGPAAGFLALGTGLELLTLAGSETLVENMAWLTGASGLLLALTPWVGFACMYRPAPALSEFDRLWLSLRDRFGLVWGQRVREQFNRAAAHAGWPVVLSWRGLHRAPGTDLPTPEPEAMVTTLRALLKRFGIA